MATHTCTSELSVPVQPLTRVILWSAPRCLSTVFERSVRELSSVKVIYEPHQGAFYGPQTKQDRLRGKEVEVGWQNKYIYTYDYADSRLLADYEGYSCVFVKNMAYFIPKDRFCRYTEGDFSNFKHTFLIRNPRQTVISRWKACMKSRFPFPGPPGREADAYQILYELLECVCSTGRQVTVVDAADLLSDPEAIMKRYCAETGLPYDKKMLTWSPGVVEDWTFNEFFEDWHWNAMYSSGFNVGLLPRNNDNVLSSTESFPPEVDEAIQKALPYYELMQKKCIKLS